MSFWKKEASSIKKSTKVRWYCTFIESGRERKSIQLPKLQTCCYIWATPQKNGFSNCRYNLFVSLKLSYQQLTDFYKTSRIREISLDIRDSPPEWPILVIVTSCFACESFSKMSCLSCRHLQYWKLRWTTGYLKIYSFSSCNRGKKGWFRCISGSLFVDPNSGQEILPEKP